MSSEALEMTETITVSSKEMKLLSDKCDELQTKLDLATAKIARLKANCKKDISEYSTRQLIEEVLNHLWPKKQ